MTYKQSKENLINVINYINNNKIELDIDCRTNVKLLIKLWKYKELTLSHLTMAKEYLHPCISNFIFNINNDNKLINLWKEYLSNVMEYRINLNMDLVKQFNFNKYKIT
jgi:hypothetical protein